MGNGKKRKSDSSKKDENQKRQGRGRSMQDNGSRDNSQDRQSMERSPMPTRKRKFVRANASAEMGEFSNADIVELKVPEGEEFENTSVMFEDGEFGTTRMEVQATVHDNGEELSQESLVFSKEDDPEDEDYEQVVEPEDMDEHEDSENNNSNAIGISRLVPAGTKGKVGKKIEELALSQIPRWEKDKNDIKDLQEKIADMERLLLENKAQQLRQQTQSAITGMMNSVSENYDHSGGGKATVVNSSETTIYRPALDIQAGNSQLDQEEDLEIQFKMNDKAVNRLSSSSEEPINTSDELEVEPEPKTMRENNLNLDKLILESRAELMNRGRSGPDMDGQMPLMSGGMPLPPPPPGGRRPQTIQHQIPNESAINKNRQRYLQPEEEKAERLIWEAEQAKIHMFRVQGRGQNDDNINKGLNVLVRDTSVVDDDYLLVASHVDEGIQRSIGKGEYVDFNKLLPKDRVVSSVEEQRLQMVSKNGQTYFVPADRDNNILNFGKWEQAFRVFANVYLRFNPDRATEPIEYNHVIHSAAVNFNWEAVYQYDKDFRLHMAWHPQRNWAIILQQAWLMRLISRQGRNFEQGNREENKGRWDSKDICWKYNKGKCTYGMKCKFQHKCGICSKYRHGAHLCRRGSGGNINNNSTHNQGSQNWEGKNGKAQK